MKNPRREKQLTNEFMEFMKKMEEKVFEKFDYELSCKK
jgi:hypothetical protein